MLSLYDSMPRGVSKFGSLIWRLALPPKPLAMYGNHDTPHGFDIKTLCCCTLPRGIRKPKKLGGALTQFPSSPLLFTDITLRSRLGYLDSGANIAYTLSHLCPDFKVAYPNNDREPKNKLVPLIIETYEDKKFVNDLLRSIGGFAMPHSWTVMRAQTFSETFRNLIFPSLSQRSLFEVVAAWLAQHDGRDLVDLAAKIASLTLLTPGRSGTGLGLPGAAKAHFGHPANAEKVQKVETTGN
ncbi:fungal specific transcription factor domain-containing, partial [Fusarium albosuccineum]